MKNLLLNIYGDVLFLYKNFFHFNLSKILIFLTTVGYVIVLFLPLIIVFLIIFYFLGMFDGSFNPYLFLGNPYYMGFGILFFILSFFVYIIGYSYSQVLLTKLSLNYNQRKKLAFSQNYYFNKKLFFAYLKLSFLLIGLFLLPILLWVIISIILIIIFGGVEASLQVVNSGAGNGLSLALLINTLFSILFFVYLSYKTIFSYIILVDEFSKNQETQSASYYIKESFKITKGFKKFIRLFLVLLILSLVVSPIYYFENKFSTKADEISVYINYDTIVKAGGDLGENTLDYQALKLDYGDKSIEELSYDIRKYGKLSLLFYILEFLFVWGLYNMILVSFYKSEKNS